MSGRRCCCVVGCKNNYNDISKWKKEVCIIHNINHGIGRCICPPPFVLVTFPKKDFETWKEWIKRVNHKGWQPNEDSRICSMHFVNFNIHERRPDVKYPYPTLNMGYQLTPEQVREKRKPPSERCSPPIKRSKCVDLTDVISECEVKTEVQHESVISSAVTSMDIEDRHHTKNVPCDEHCGLPSIKCKNCEILKRKIKHLQNQLIYYQNLCSQKQHKPIGLDILKSDAKVKCYTGLPSKEVLNGIFGSFGDKVKKIRYWHGPSKTVNKKQLSRKVKFGPPKFLTAKEEFFITLFRTKTMLKAEIIGDLFGVSSTVIS